MTTVNPNDLSLPDGFALACAAFAEGAKPPPRLSVSEWADQFRRLPSKGAGEPGPWRTARVPYSREIMETLSLSHPAKRIVFIKSVQSAGTEIGNNWVGWFIDTQKSPMMIVQPTLDMAERWSKQRLAAMVDDTPSLRRKIAPARSRDSGNTTLMKEWPGGLLVVSGANSGASLRSMPARYLFLDEVDAYPMEIEGEGDPVRLAEARTTTFPRRKVFLVSTPTIESLSRIHKEWMASDQRRFHVACPECQTPQTLLWDNLKWTEGHPETAVYHCSACGVGIAEHHKAAMLAAGFWQASCPESDVVGFHINALYTPPGLGLTWAELASEWESVKRDPAREKAFINLRLGEAVPDPNEKVDADDLASRAGGYRLREIPKGCLLLTAGVDVQADRFAVLILGHGRGGRQWLIDYHELPGDPTNSDDWLRLEARLAEPLQNAMGYPMRPSLVAIDAGYLSDRVYTFTRQRRSRGFIAVKGASSPGKPIINRPSKVDVTAAGQAVKYGAEVWLVGGDTAKHDIFSRLIADGKRASDYRMVNFPDGVDPSFYSQLTAEVWDSNRRRWVKVRPRNEALDTWCYAMAAFNHPSIRGHLYRDAAWAKLESILEPQTGDLFTGPTPPKPVIVDPGDEPPPPVPRRRRAVSSYMQKGR